MVASAVRRLTRFNAMTRLGCLQGPHPGDRRLHLAPGAGWRERQLSSKCRFILSRHGQLEQFEVEALPRDGCAVTGSGSSSGEATPIWRGPVAIDRYHSVWRRLRLPIRAPPVSHLFSPGLRAHSSYLSSVPCTRSVVEGVESGWPALHVAVPGARNTATRTIRPAVWRDESRDLESCREFGSLRLLGTLRVFGLPHAVVPQVPCQVFLR